MNRNIRLEVAFDGTAYSGWQRQKDKRTIQGELERAVARMTGEPVTVHGAGRTDAGVHALAMAASFRTSTDIPAAGLHKGLNSFLPEDIRVVSAVQAPPDFHPRKSAVGKIYAYHLSFGGPGLPTDRLYCWQLPVSLDLEVMESCLRLVIGTHDFSSFEATGSRDPELPGRGAVRTISAAELLHCRDSRIIIRLSGDGFLRHMVRNIVGTLVEAGRGRMDADGFATVIAARDRSVAGPTAPARGLFLEQVLYKT